VQAVSIGETARAFIRQFPENFRENGAAFRRLRSARIKP
jgi:hypothetical protein